MSLAREQSTLLVLLSPNKAEILTMPMLFTSRGLAPLSMPGAAPVAGLLLVLLSACSPPPKTGLHLQEAYIKTVIPGRSVTAAYATLYNHDSEALCLVGFDAAFASTVELHETRRTGGPNSDRVAMHAVPELCIEPGGSATLAPGGMHLMVMGLTQLPPDQATIRFGTKSGRAFAAEFSVRPFTE